jgi:hypothetical protein
MLTEVFLCVIPPFIINCTLKEQRRLEQSAPKWSQFAISDASEIRRFYDEKQSDIFRANQNIVCLLRDAPTVDFLLKEFGIT